MVKEFRTRLAWISLHASEFQQVPRCKISFVQIIIKKSTNKTINIWVIRVEQAKSEKDLPYCLKLFSIINRVRSKTLLKLLGFSMI